MEAREAVMNGAKVRLRRYPPYLRCPLCGGDGSNLRPLRFYTHRIIEPVGPFYVQAGAWYLHLEIGSRAWGFYLMCCGPHPEGWEVVG